MRESKHLKLVVCSTVISSLLPCIRLSGSCIRVEVYTLYFFPALQSLQSLPRLYTVRRAEGGTTCKAASVFGAVFQEASPCTK